MPVDGILLNKLVTMMNKDLPMKINKISQASHHDIIFSCFGKEKKNLFISTHPVFSRIQWTQSKNNQNLDPSHFLLLLRKHLNGGIIESIRQIENDRVVEILIQHRDEMGVIRPYRFMIELLGKYANMILVDDRNIIVDAHKRIASFESGGRSLVSGSSYSYPPKQDKLSIEYLSDYDPQEALVQQFYGISPLLEKELLYRLERESAQSILEMIHHSSDLYIYSHDFHIIDLTHKKENAKVLPLMAGLDAFYEEIQEQDRIKTVTGDIRKTIKRELKRNRQKLPKLLDELDRAQDYEKYRDYGDLLYAFASDLSSGHKRFSHADFKGDLVEVELDPRFDGKGNAKRYFKQYQKAKTSISYLEEQIRLTQAQLDYYNDLDEQVSFASVADALEIKEELIGRRIMRDNKPKSKKKKEVKPHITSIHYDEDTLILIGKNNIQNDYLSFKLGRKNDLWFHAAHTSGAHVLLQTEKLDEAKIRLCAHLAAYYSKSRYASSVEVHYTPLYNIKKIPGAALGKVNMKSHKSIFIDPDEGLVRSFLKL